jgi:hypothetical protein
MPAVLRVHCHEEMSVRWHDCECQHLGIRCGPEALDNLLKTPGNARYQHGTALRGTPDNVLCAGGNHVVLECVVEGIV